MRNRFFVACLLVAVGLLCGVQGARAGAGVTAKLGTLGYGADLTIGVQEQMNIRLGYHMADYDLEGGSDNNDILWTLDWQNISALIDWHPSANGFRVSGGAVLNNNQVIMDADLGEPVDINDVAYWVSTFNGTATFDDLAGYLGFGYGNAVGEDGHWHFACDIGIMFQGVPEIELTAVAVEPALQPLLDADLAVEEEQLQEDAEVLRFWPVVAVGISYRF